MVSACDSLSNERQRMFVLRLSFAVLAIVSTLALTPAQAPALDSYNAFSPSDSLDHVPESIPEIERGRLLRWRAELERVIDSVNTVGDRFNDRCSVLPRGDTGALSRCQSEFAVLMRARTEIDLAKLKFNESVRVASQRGLRIIEPPSPVRQYVASGDGLIGGTGWIYGYNIPAGAAGRAVRAKADAALRRLQHEGTGPLIDPSEYRFILGVAAGYGTIVDLASRVFFDNFRNGQASAEDQALYASLTGRRFDRLDCHSNGAMVCLAALQNDDARAQEVRLFGPQITPESASLWNELVTTKRVRGVTVYISTGDPVPLVSYLLGTVARASSTASFLLSIVGGVERAAKVEAPNVNFITLSCPHLRFPMSGACHDMATYQRASRR